MPTAPKRDRKLSIDLREVLNALRYKARPGGGWRMLPKDFPKRCSFPTLPPLI
ncbi:transposase [Pacificimonas sp. ICDLI1SI03]